MRTWSTTGGYTYSEKVFPNRKVGQIIGTNNGRGHWVALLDGIPCGTTGDKTNAMDMVDAKYKERYG
jgi:hypothetical protein